MIDFYLIWTFSLLRATQIDDCCKKGPTLSHFAGPKCNMHMWNRRVMSVVWSEKLNVIRKFLFSMQICNITSDIPLMQCNTLHTQQTCHCHMTAKCKHAQDAAAAVRHTCKHPKAENGLKGPKHDACFLIFSYFLLFQRKNTAVSFFL